ncbi:Exopolyphosphatase [Steccherinum ochraceum]|uniref:Exopolyphosphatase n=1 Tax=Steccherinum ochraceum TaxID=92696 RepID=A0A4R0R280_9APHY|nr:Exopolyphosphatase [Steccherinum ochraceum]
MAPKAASSTLSDFLKEQKTRYLEAVKEGKGREWTVAMGNEAGDLDSLSSAIAYSWYASTVQKSATVALFRAQKSDLHLRAENLYALELAGLDPSDPPVLCLDDLPSTPPFPSNRFALVDHNHLDSDFTRDNTDPRVVAVIDHHEDEGSHKDTADPRVITVPTGSASSLVALHLAAQCPDQVPAELATLLLSSIMIDTGGLKPGGKAEQPDRAAAAFLTPRSLLPSDASSLSATSLHEDAEIKELASNLSAKKFSISHLTTRDLLRRDYKEYSMTPSWAKDQLIHVGLASVPLGLKALIARDDTFWSATQQWMADRNLSVLGILTSFRAEKKTNKKGNPKHKREQLFLVREETRVPGVAEKLLAGLEASEDLKLKKKKKALPKDETAVSGVTVGAWKQGNVDATRKVTAPLVKGVIEGSA